MKGAAQWAAAREVDMPEQRTFYDILDIDRGASAQEIRDAFRRCARERHPDRFKGAERATAEREFQALTEAYNVLVDPEQRARYDQATDARGATRLSDPREIAKALLAKAVTLVKSGQHAEAQQAFRQALGHDAQNARAHHLYGLFLAQQLGQPDEGLRHLDQAAKLDPLNSKVLLDASKLFAHARMFARAYRLAQQAARLDPDDRAIEAWVQQLAGMGGT
jgi:curved DNA-binding protein CbpA